MISVALACYNGEKFIKEQIYSILNQKDVELEIVICDDCSTDNTVKIIKEIQKEDQRIFLFQNEKQLGVVKNFEKAIGLCKGEFIALSDQDDVWEPEKLQLQLEVFKNNYSNKPLLITHDLNEVDENLNLICPSIWKKFNYKISHRPEVYFLSNCLTGCTIFTKKDDLVKMLPFKSSLLHDHQIYCYFQYFGRVYFFNKTLINFRRHNNNQTTTFKGNIFYRIINYTKIIFSNNFLYNEKIHYFNFIERYENSINKKDFMIINLLVKLPTILLKPILTLIYKIC
jgi:glycosyltransferase involved in cell wall biosynthesis